MTSNTTCLTRTWIVDDVDRHFKTSSNLFFLFGVQIHRPFVNEDEQRHADASVFIIALCKSRSSDCIAKGGSLPWDYQLEMTIASVPYSAQR